MGKEFIAGVSFTDNAAQVAVLKLRRGEVTIVHLEECTIGAGGELWFLESLLGKKNKIFKKVSKVSVALDSGCVFLHTFPLDAGLTHSEQNDHLQWELSNFIQDFQQKDHINDVHVLKSHTEEQYADMLVVSARRSFIRQIQHTLHDQKFSLHLVEANHFAGQYALAVNYPELKEKTIALASASQQRVDIGTLACGKLISYRYFVETSRQSLAKSLQEFCLQTSVEDVFIYGSGCTFPLMKALHDCPGVRITKINPFRRLPVSSSLRETGMMIGQEHKFVASVGVALRKE